MLRPPPLVSGDPLLRLTTLRGRSWDELRERSAQLLSSRLERAEPIARRLRRDTAALDRYVAGRLLTSASPESLLAAFRDREAPRFFRSFDQRADMSAALRRLDGDGTSRVIHLADRICAGYANLLGYEDVAIGVKPDWHRDPLLDVRAPLTHWSRIAFLDPAVVGDHKLVWELNRHQYFGILGRAYWRTGDERYAAQFANHVESWIEENPAKCGVNWASSLELAFRSISWCWAAHFFRHSPVLTPTLYAKILGSLDLHARHIARYLSTYFSPNTHLTGEALGLYYIGTVFPELRLANRWRELGCRILLEQVDRHVLPDGVYFEQTTHYQRYTADFYTHLLLLSAASGPDLSDRIAPKLEALLDCSMHMTRPDGRTPTVGDDDGGRLMFLDEREPNDYRATLSTGAVILRRPDFAFVAGNLAEETLWLVGPSASATWKEVGCEAPRSTSRGFPDGGYYVMRDGWTTASQFAVVDCGPHGTQNCGHAHADALAIELAADGRSWLVDPGTYSYTTVPADRDWFRHAAAHCTVTVDGSSSSEPFGPFAWRSMATSRTLSWQTHSRFDYFAGTHDGFARLWPGATHRREVLHLRGNYWVIRDRVTANGKHDVSHHFQFAPDVEVAVTAPDTVVATSASPLATLRLHALADAGRFTVQTRWVSPAYGVRTPAPNVAFTVTADGRTDVVTLVLPGSSVSAGAQVTRARTGTTSVVQVRDADIIDVLLLDATNGAAASGVSAEAEWAWVRLSAGTGEPVEFVLLGGRSLHVGDSSIVFPNPVRFAAGRRHADGWAIESDAVGTRAERGAFADGRSRSTVTR